MAWKVQYQERGTGKMVLSPAFGVEALAQSYARTVKGGVVIPVDVAAPPVAVQACPAPVVVQAQRAADREAALAERLAEAAVEAGTQARLMGASPSEALDVAWAARGRLTEDALDPIPGTELQYVCGMCGRKCYGGLTMCRKCGRT